MITLPAQAHRQVNAYTELMSRVRQEGLLARSPRTYARRLALLGTGFAFALIAMLALGQT